MERIETFNNNCTLVAVKFVLNGTKTDDELLAAFREEGYVDNQGMRHAKWTAAASRLGLKLAEVKIPWKMGKYIHVKYTDRYGDEDTTRRWVPNRYTLAQFCKDNPYGTFFVSLRSHAVVVTDGKLWDPNCASQTMARGVEAAKEVLNAPKIKISGKVTWIPSGRVGSQTWERRASARAYISAMGGAATPEDIVANTKYTRDDYEWDLKRGNVRFRQN